MKTEEIEGNESMKDVDCWKFVLVTWLVIVWSWFNTFIAEFRL